MCVGCIWNIGPLIVLPDRLGSISNKTFDFSKTTIRQLIQDGYKQAKEQMKGVEVRGNNLAELIKLFFVVIWPC